MRRRIHHMRRGIHMRRRIPHMRRGIHMRRRIHHMRRGIHTRRRIHHNLKKRCARAEDTDMRLFLGASNLHTCCIIIR